MGLGSDQAALLRLILGGQGYEDVAGVLGLSAAEARERAHSAVRELGGADIPDAAADSLLAPAMGDSAPAGPGVWGDDAELAAARRAAAALRDLAPEAEIPEPGTGGDGGDGRTGPSGRFLTAALAAVAVVLVAVLAITGTLSGSDGEPTGGGDRAAEEDVVEIPLEAVGGSGAVGSARLIRVEDVPALVLDLRRLQPSGTERSYIVWLYNNERQAFPVGFRPVGPEGKIRGVVSIPAVAASLLPEFDALDVSLAEIATARRVIATAGRSGNLPPHTGTSVLRGKLPRG